MNVPELSDGNPTTCFVGTEGVNKVIFDEQYTVPIQSYKIYSSGETPVHDPSAWTLKGSYDGKNWVVVDERKDQTFCSRYQEILCSITKPSNYKQYMLEAATAVGDTLVLGDVVLFDENLNAGWEDFKYPEIDYEVIDPETKGAAIYADLVQNPDEYIRYHARKVAEILFYSAKDTMNDVQKVHYTLKIMTEFQPRVVIRPIPRLFTALSILRNQRTNPSISSTLKHVVSCFMNWYTPISSNRKESVPIQPTKHSGLVSKGWRMQSVPKQDISI